MHSGSAASIDASIAVLIAAYNESDRVGETVRALLEISDAVAPVVHVVDDGSADNTAKAASEAGAEVLRSTKNAGKGSALNDLIKHHFLKDPPAVAVLLDADLGKTARLYSVLLEPIIKGQADLTIAVFPRSDIKAGFGLVKGLARWGIERKTGFRSREPLSGQRAMRGDVLKAVYPLASGFGVEVKMTIDALLKGYRIVEVEVPFSHRHSTRSVRGFMHRGKQFAHVLKVLLLGIRI